MTRNVAGAVQYAAWRVVSATIGRMPPWASYPFAQVIGTVAYYCWPRARRSMHANYRRVLRGESAARQSQAARRSLVNYCKYLADFVRFPRLDADDVLAAVDSGSGFERLDCVLERGKGAVIVCMHFGNWDLGAAATASRGYPLTVVAETFADARLDAMVSSSRTRLGMNLVKMERAGPSLLRTLKQNGLLALLIDRSVPGEGVKVTFFGEEVEVPAGPARLALRTGATVVPAAFARVSPRRPDVTALCDFDIDTVATGDDERDIQALTQRIMNSHERFIRAYPEQWYMFRPMWTSGRPR